MLARQKVIQKSYYKIVPGLLKIFIYIRCVTF